MTSFDNMVIVFDMKTFSTFYTIPISLLWELLSWIINLNSLLYYALSYISFTVLYVMSLYMYILEYDL